MVIQVQSTPDLSSACPVYTHPICLHPFPHLLSSPSSTIPPPTSIYSTLPTNSLSIPLTPSLNASTSLQQSNGLRSFTLKHPITRSLASSTSRGSFCTVFRLPSCSLNFSSSDSTCAVLSGPSPFFSPPPSCREEVKGSRSDAENDGRSSRLASPFFGAPPSPLFSDDAGDRSASSASFFFNAFRVSVSRFWIFSSSSATRWAMCRSSDFARVEFVCCAARGGRISQCTSFWERPRKTEEGVGDCTWLGRRRGGKGRSVPRN